jgi:WD40 repeat protein
MSLHYVNKDLLSHSCVAASHDGNKFAAGCHFGVALWTDISAAPVNIPFDDERRPRRLSFNPAGTLLAIGSVDGTTTLVETTTRKSSVCPNGSGVTAIAFSPDGSRLAVAYEDGEVKLWQSDTGLELTTLKSPFAALVALRFSHQAERLIGESTEGQFCQWQAPQKIYGEPPPGTSVQPAVHTDPLMMERVGRQFYNLTPGKIRPPMKSKSDDMPASRPETKLK